MSLPLEEDDTLRETPAWRRSSFRVIDWAARSSIGLVRAENQDSWGERDGLAFVVADGMGGTDGGVRASSLAVTHFLALDAAAGWVAALMELNRSVRRTCRVDGFPDAGTTLAGVIVQPSRCIAANIGDSRIYRFRHGDLQLLTTDHNIRTLRREEGLDPDLGDDRGGPRALTSYIGNHDDRQCIDVATISAEPGDRILLTTDGIHEVLSPEKLTRSLRLRRCRDVADELVRVADQAGGRDNSTALVVELGASDG